MIDANLFLFLFFVGTLFYKSNSKQQLKNCTLILPCMRANCTYFLQLELTVSHIMIYIYRCCTCLRRMLSAIFQPDYELNN